MRIMLLIIAFLVAMSSASVVCAQQPQALDKILAVVGEKIVLNSELEEQYAAYLESQLPVESTTRCELFGELITQKLLLNQAEIDSVEVSEGQIAGEIERRLGYFITQFGSVEKLEEFYGKTLVEIRAEFHDPIKEQLLVQTMQGKIMSTSSITPKEVKDYFNSLAKDSVPIIESEVELSQIVKKPIVSTEEEMRAKEKIKGLRDRILAGEDFGTLAFLYSEDPGSARENGALGFMSRGQLVPEFSAVAFALEAGELSEIVRTEYGFHIIQLIEKKGTEANFRHILIVPKVLSSDLTLAKSLLDSLKQEIETKPDLDFAELAKKYSDDKETKNSGGVITSPFDGSTRYELSQLSQFEPTLVYTIEELEIGEISDPVLFQTRDGKRAYRLIKLVNITEPHEANLQQDYQRLAELAEASKRDELMNNWVSKNVGKYYVRIDDEFNQCPFVKDWQLAIKQ